MDTNRLKRQEPAQAPVVKSLFHLFLAMDCASVKHCVQFLSAQTTRTWRGLDPSTISKSYVLHQIRQVRSSTAPIQSRSPQFFGISVARWSSSTKGGCQVGQLCSRTQCCSLIILIHSSHVVLVLGMPGVCVLKTVSATLVVQHRLADLP